MTACGTFEPGQPQRMPRIGAAGEKFRILTDQSLAAIAAAGGDRFADGDDGTPPREPLGDRAGDNGFPDAGVGAGDEQAGDGDGVEHGAFLSWVEFSQMIEIDHGKSPRL